MNPQTIQTRIEDALAAAQVEITGEGCNLGATIVSPDFEGKSRLERHKMVMALVQEEIRSGELHAFTLKLKTPNEA